MVMRFGSFETVEVNPDARIAPGKVHTPNLPQRFRVEADRTGRGEMVAHSSDHRMNDEPRGSVRV